MQMPNIKINDFDGPFDLLLHLIRKNKMSIYNVEIYKITNQYLKYLDEMKQMDLEITSEFIVVAATLIEIKSKKLLPKPKKEDEEDEEDIEKKLLEKLIIYKKIKESTAFFRERYRNSGNIYTKKPEIIEEVKDSSVNNDDIFKNITLLDLYHIYNNLLDIYVNKQNKANVIKKKIYVDKYKIEDKVEYLSQKLVCGKSTEFSTLMKECECKIECIVTFLAMLELIKQKVIKVYQNSNFGEILIERQSVNE
ncbi:segregation/condensation protein A [Clostridium sp. HCP1S3_B4]|uniref:segregation/condensation protein A n=1 Tax=unclassified Clostridium TaxID=2614128 RepID=UPI0016A1B82E|nr:segregation/condensation protein A [Clostridiales bacterium]MDY2729585.1 segregation/condensation protein A [Clostridium sp.]NLK22548.1 segregation/condensation protein A [Clostridiales bacterium]